MLEFHVEHVPYSSAETETGKPIEYPGFWYAWVSDKYGATFNIVESPTFPTHDQVVTELEKTIISARRALDAIKQNEGTEVNA